MWPADEPRSGTKPEADFLEAALPSAYGQCMRRNGRTPGQRPFQLLLISLIVAGCASSKGPETDLPPRREDPPPTNPEKVYWLPVPKEMRIYQTTRFVREAGQPILEAHIRFFDEMGHAVKGAGMLHFELLRGDHERAGIGRRLYKWDAKLLTLEDQQSFFYSITNGYLFRLKIDALPIASKRTTFRATLIGPDNLRLESQTVLEPKKVEEALPPPED